jgi:heme/copper-type cytochrome/quinol oxidase subunit 3
MSAPDHHHQEVPMSLPVSRSVPSPLPHPPAPTSPGVDDLLERKHGIKRLFNQVNVKSQDDSKPAAEKRRKLDRFLFFFSFSFFSFSFFFADAFCAFYSFQSESEIAKEIYSVRPPPPPLPRPQPQPQPQSLPKQASAPLPLPAPSPAPLLVPAPVPVQVKAEENPRQQQQQQQQQQPPRFVRGEERCEDIGLSFQSRSCEDMLITTIRPPQNARPPSAVCPVCQKRAALEIHSGFKNTGVDMPTVLFNGQDVPLLSSEVTLSFSFFLFFLFSSFLFFHSFFVAFFFFSFYQSLPGRRSLRTHQIGRTLPVPK